MHGPELEDDEDPISNENHFFTVDGLPIYIMEDEENLEILVVQKDEDFIIANETFMEEESYEYQRGYKNALIVQQRHYSLRSRDVPINPVQKRKEVAQPKNDSPNV